MNCSSTGLVDSTSNRGVVFWIELTSLVVIGLVQMAANVFLVTRLCARRERTTSPFHCLLKAQCFWGVMLLVAAIPIHIVILVSGGKTLTEVTCCITGTVFQVILGTFNTIAMLLSLERYMKVIKSGEHLALFSKVNVRLMLWSAVLLHCMVSLGPAYGWGQYTHSSERLRLWLVPRTGEQNNSSEDSHRSSTSLNYKLINREITREKLASVFKDSQVSSTEFYAFPTGIELDLIGKADVGLGCVRDQYRSGVLSEILFKFFLEESRAFHTTNGQNFSQLQVDLDDSTVVVHRDTSYYDSTICEVNYQVTSASDNFYLLMTSLVQIVLPVAFIIFFSARVIHRIWISGHRSKVTLLNKDYELTLESLIGSLTFTLLVTPYYITNFAVRYGRQVSAAGHFAVRFMLYMSAAGGAATHFVVHRQQIIDYWHAKVSNLSWEKDMGLANDRTLADERSNPERQDGDSEEKNSQTAPGRRVLTVGDRETSVV